MIQLNIFRRFVLITSFPFVSRGQQSLALSLLEEVSAQASDASRASYDTTRGPMPSIARIDGKHPNDAAAHHSVTPASTPYLILCERHNPSSAGDSMRTLLSAHYRYDVGSLRDAAQVLSETQKWLEKEILHVARLKSLLIGSEVLITCTTLMSNTTSALPN
ncbi:hypothetical protein HYQ46_010404 [Verticillium longisporum]|nr:hypothetical protein HYQ46_010404 [Verticillium longisporum]